VAVVAASAIKVLVIDDSNTIRRSAELFLRQAGYEVILAEDGFDALAKISDHQPQVIFVDIMMAPTATSPSPSPRKGWSRRSRSTSSPPVFPPRKVKRCRSRTS
jgi:hypothetical protein